LFYGSSSIRLWSTLVQDFSHLKPVNHGFGGSTLAECVAAMELLVYPVKPRAIVFYAGDNDLDAGTEPHQVAALLERFMASVLARVGPIPVLVLAVKPSPCRWGNADNIRRANEHFRQVLSRFPQAQFLDVFHPMLNAAGQPRLELFAEDRLHLNADGYQLWKQWVSQALVNMGIDA
jgi:lysophospholipase L1-like esterase